MNWYIGQEIVAIEDHCQLYFKEGDVFPIKGLMECNCKCNGGVLIDIGQTIPKHFVTTCESCNDSFTNHNGVAWHSEESFRPLDELADITELTEILENTKPFEVK